VVEGVDRFRVERKRFAGPDDLNWTLRVIDQIAEQFGIASDEIGPLVTGKAAGPHQGEHVRVEVLAGLIGHMSEEFAFEFELARADRADVRSQAGGVEILVAPVFFVLGIGDVGDVADVRKFLPHLAGHFTVDFGDPVGGMAQTQSGQRVVENIAGDAGDGADFRFGHIAEKGKLAQQMEVMLFVAGLLRGVSGEDETLFDFLQTAESFVDAEGGG